MKLRQLAFLLVLVSASASAAPAFESLSARPYADCTGDFSAVEMADVYAQGRTWIDLKLQTLTRNCRETADGTTCGAWAVQTPKVAAAVNYKTGIENLGGAAKIVLYPENGKRVVGELTQARAASDLAVTINSWVSSTWCRGWAGAGGEGCYWEEVSRWETEFAKLTGKISESCVALASDVHRSDTIAFGADVKSYVETVYYLVDTR